VVIQLWWVINRGILYVWHVRRYGPASGLRNSFPLWTEGEEGVHWGSKSFFRPYVLFLMYVHMQ
jgi:hypothetical protein